MGHPDQNELENVLFSFLRSFDDKTSTCISCHKVLEAARSRLDNSELPSNSISERVVKEICLKSIVPQSNLNLKKYGHIGTVDYFESEYFPFCQECTGLVSTLTTLYRQLEAIQEEYDKVRGQLVRGVVKTYAQQGEKKCHNHNESEMFNQWQVAMGISADPANQKDQHSETEMEPVMITSEVSHFNVQPDNLIDVKMEIKEEDDGFETEELELLEEIIVPEKPASSEDIVFQPFIQLERLPEPKGKTILSKPFDHENVEHFITNGDDGNDSNSDGPIDCQSDGSLPDMEELKTAGDDYVPPHHLRIQKYGVLTRTKAKSAALINKRLSSVSSAQESDEVENDPSTDSDAEEVVVSRAKRKYTPRSTGPASKKKKLKQTTKSSTFTGIDKTDGNEFETDDATSSAIKTKPKRIRKPLQPVECSICKKIIASKWHLKVHMRVHTGEKPYKCTYCEKRFYKNSNLRSHMSRHTNKRPYACSICDARFSENSAMKSHKAAQHEVFETDVILECEFCLKKFLIPGRLAEHVRTVHNPEKSRLSNFWCSFCIIDFKTVEELKEHKGTEQHLVMESSSKETRRRQTETVRAERKILVRRKRDLERYNERKGNTKVKVDRTKSNSKTLEVRKKRSLERKGNAKKKLGRTESNSEGIEALTDKPQCGRKGKTRERSCAECNLKFPDYRVFTAHRRKFHPNPKTPKRNFQCEICGKVCSESGNLKKHLAVHSGDKPHVCDFCGERFAAKISLKLHLTKHTSQSFHTCEFCSKGFNKLRTFRKHLNEVHPEIHLKDKPVICKCCYMNFESEQILTEHMRTHDHLKCKFCGRPFGLKCHLDKHLLVHTGERPYKCTQCSKTFTQWPNLKEHEYRHTGERPFSCTYCNAGFFRRKVMQKHIEKDHPNRVSQNNSTQLQVNEDPSAVTSSPTFTNL